MTKTTLMLTEYACPVTQLRVEMCQACSMGPRSAHHVHAHCPHLLAGQPSVLLLQVVSQADASGEMVVKNLASVQGQSFDKPTILITEEVGGMEDIPVSSACVAAFTAVFPPSLI